jgi:hypothetical protein
MRTNIKRFIGIGGLIALTLSFASFADAWTGPTSTPPEGNASAPINAGATTQTKAGVFNAYGMRSYVDLIVDDNAYADAFFYNSDRNLKKDIKPLKGSLSKILKLEGVSFAWKNEGDKNVGLIAQDVEKVYPELVITNPSTGLKSVEYGNLVAPLIEAVKEQQKEIEFLKAEIERLKAR